MNKVQGILIGVIIILIVASVFWGIEYFLAQEKLNTLLKTAKIQQLNEKIISFNKLFINKVLKAQADVSLEDRLKLENAVRDLNDPEVLAQWQKFTDCATQEQAQQEVKNLLDMLANKIVIK